MSSTTAVRREEVAPDDANPPDGIERVPPSARCHGCGSTEIRAVCCRCARLLCAQHDLVAGRPGPRAVLASFRQSLHGHHGSEPRTGTPATADRKTSSGVAPKADQQDPSREDGGAGAPAPGTGANSGSQEAEGRRIAGGDGATRSEREGAQDRGSAVPHRERPTGAPQRHYCIDCVPQVRPLDGEIIAATVTTGLGAAVVPVQAALGGVVVAVGTIRLVIRTLMGLRRHARQAGEHSTELALNPNVRKLEARERIRGSAHHTDDRRHVRRVDEVFGSVKLEGNWSRVHRHELDKRLRRRPGATPSTVAAGHLVLHGPGRVRFRSTRGVRARGAALVVEPLIAEQPVLSGPPRRSDSRWRPEFRYDIAPPEGDRSRALPVWVTPDIAADSDRHVLELHVQWSTRGPEPTDDGVPLRSIHELKVEVPAEWGSIEHVSALGGDVVIGQPERSDAGGIALRGVTWKKVPCDGEGDRGSKRFFVRFSEQIDLDQHHVLRGRLEARFTGAVSGLSRIDLYGTDGSPRHLDGSRKLLTVVEADLVLSLQGLRYQEHRAVPDRARPEDDERREARTFPGLVPDHRTVAQLTDHLADQGYYIIRVLENPAQAGVRRLALNRLWDLAGRYYKGVYPIDFHLVLSGEEVHRGQHVTGESTVALTLHGSYANPEMKQLVVDEWTRLWKCVEFSVEAASRGPDGRPRMPEQPLDSSGKELARLRSRMVEVVRRIADAAADERIEAGLADDLVVQLTDEFGLGDV
jgi:hypothetical protein